MTFELVAFAAASTVMSGSSANAGGVTSFTVTVNDVVAVLPAASDAMQLTRV